MEKIKCALCGSEVLKKSAVMTFDIGSGKDLFICTPCYYKELTQDMREKEAENESREEAGRAEE